MADRLQGRDVFLHLNYEGNRMDLYLGEKKINDHFYTGQEVPVSLGYFDFPEKLRVVVHALHEKEAVFLETWPELKDGMACRLNGVRVEEVFR